MDKFSELLARMNKADIFFDNPNVSDEKKQEFIPMFIQLLKEINAVYNDISGKE